MSDADLLFQRLAHMWQATDPMPDGLSERVLAAIAMEDFDAEYELLHLVERSHELQGVRGASDVLTIEFSNGSFSMLLRVSEVDEKHRRVDGWVAPAKPMKVSVQQGSKTLDGDVGRLGRFEFANLPVGLSRIWLTADDSGAVEASGSEQLFATPTFEL